MRTYFVFYRSFYEAIAELPEANQLELYRAIFELSLNENEPELTGLSKTVFTLIRPQIVANNQRFKNGTKAKAKRNGSETEAKPKQTESKTEANKNKNKNKNKNEIQNFNSFLEKIENPESFPEWKNSCSEFLNSGSFKDSYSKLKKVPIGNLEKVMMDFLLNVNGRGLFKDCAGLIAHFKNFYPKHVENKVNTPSFQNSKGFIDVPDNLDYDKMETW